MSSESHLSIKVELLQGSKTCVIYKDNQRFLACVYMIKVSEIW